MGYVTDPPILQPKSVRSLEGGAVLSDILEECVASLRRRIFHVDCIHMELSRESDGKCYMGPGYIQQKSDKDFEIKLYVDGMPDFEGAFAEGFSIQAGVLIRQADHFSLFARDAMNRTWKADHIIMPESNGRNDQKGSVTTATCQEVTLVQTRWPEETGNSLELYAFGSIEFPRTSFTEETVKVGKTRHITRSRRNATEIESNGWSFCFEEDNGLKVLVSSKETPLHAQLEWRVTEAIMFALGALPTWSRITRVEGTGRITRFRSFEERMLKPQQTPPLMIQFVEGFESVWDMFRLFLTYVLKITDVPTHPLARHITGILHTRGTSAEGQALTVAVAVESVLTQFYRDIGKPHEDHIQSVNQFITHVRTWNGDKTIVERAMGSLHNLKSARADDRLRALVAKGIVGESGRIAWKQLRNTAAHGEWHKYEGRLQELLDLRSKVFGLFNQLIFHLIGYAGKQTDYGEPGWPTVQYPLTEIDIAESQ